VNNWRTEWEGLADEIAAMVALGSTDGEAGFNDLALRVFDFQLRNNEFLSRYVSLATFAPPSHYREVPPLPTSAFKHADVRSFPPGEEIGFFQTSGTTTGNAGRHRFASFRLYEAAIVPNCRHHLLPDTSRMRMLILTPPPDEAPHSSLVHMMQTVLTEFGTSDSRFLVHRDQLENEMLLNCLRESGSAGNPVFLLGTALAFAQVLDWIDRSGEGFLLPAGSRIMETGGFKGRSRELPRHEFYPRLSRALGVPPHGIVNEYGMTELSSQFYDTSFVSGEPTDWKQMPHWTRVSAADPLTGQPVPDGSTGLLRILDLANLGSAIAIQTEDVGIVSGDRFRVLGRHLSAVPRGCSLSAEEYRIASDGKGSGA
jgi:hypothetical protein